MNWLRDTLKKNRTFVLAFLLVETFYWADGLQFVYAHEIREQEREVHFQRLSGLLGIPVEKLRGERWSLFGPLEELAEDASSSVGVALDSLSSTLRRQTHRAKSEVSSLDEILGAPPVAPEATPAASVEPAAFLGSPQETEKPESAKIRTIPRATAATQDTPRERTGRAPRNEPKALPLRHVERKARTEKAVGTARSVHSSAVAPASTPRRVIPKDAVAPEIAALAESLGNSPADIFSFVHDKINFDPKWGAEKSPLGTLHERQGTSWDQAWLLQQLLTAAGVDARLEWGEVEISVEMLKNITGVEDPWRAGDLMTTAGTPIVLLVEGSQVKTARMSHVWVKAYLDYFPNRGVTPGPGDTWIRMDPSLKRFAIAGDLRLDAAVPYDLGEYLQSGTELSPRQFYEELLDAYVTANHPEISSLEELKRTKSVLQEAFPFVPGTLRGEILSVAGESVEMPAAFQQKLKLEVREAGGPVLATYETPWPAVYGQRLELSWPGATSSDQATLDLYGGVFSTPPFEVDLKPSIRVEGIEVASGSTIGSAEDVVVRATWTTPQGLETVVPFEMWAGEPGVLSVDFGRTPQEMVDRYTQELATATDPTEQEAWSLALAGASYQRSLGGDLVHLADLRWQRVLNLGRTVLAVQRGAVSASPDGSPLTFSRGPVELDLGSMPLGLFPAEGGEVSTVPTLELLGSQGSFLEGEALSGVFEGDHVTGVTFLTRAVREGQTLTRVDAANVDDALGGVELSAEAEASVRAAVENGSVAWIPESQLLVDTFDATGYVVEDPATGAAGYFLTYERLLQGLDANIAFHSPQDLDVVTAPTDIVATIEGEAIQSWTLSYQMAGEGPAAVLATGEGSVTEATLAQIDPTLLLNGLYDIVLTGRDVAGQTVSKKISVAVEGQMKIGFFSVSFVDLAVPLSGLDIEVIRTYDSRDKRQRDFGTGWTIDILQGSYQNNRPPGDGWQIVQGFLPCDSLIESKSHETVIRLSDHEVYRFRLTLKEMAATFGGCFAHAAFDFVDGPLPGSTLEIVGNNYVFYENQSDRVTDAETLELFEPDDVKFTTRDGRIFYLDLEDGVTRLQDLNGNDLKVTLNGITHSSGQGIEFERDDFGRITKIVDPEGQEIRYDYDAQGDLVSVTDRAEAVTSFTYEGDHYLASIVNALGVLGVRTEYDEDGRLIRVIDANGKALQFDHDLDARREVVTNRLGNARVLEYDETGNIVRMTDELGRIFLRSFNERHQMTSITDPLGRTSDFVYTAAGDLSKITDPLGHTTEITYNDRGRPLTVTDPLGHVTTYTYNANNGRAQIKDPLGRTVNYQYDSRGNRTEATDPLGQITRFEYDGLGRVTRLIDKDGAATEFDFSPNGDLLSQSRSRTLPDGTSEEVKIEHTYDPAGRLLTTTLPDGSTISKSYDALGRQVTLKNQAGELTAVSYDVESRPTSVTYPDGAIETYVYDAEGRLTTKTDRRGRTQEFFLDAVGRAEKVVAGSSEVHFSFDAGDQLRELTDPEGRLQKYEYDAAGRQVKVADGTGNGTTYEYDAAGRAVAYVNAVGERTEVEYDAAGQPTHIVLPDGTTVETTYDALGRKSSIVAPTGETKYFEYNTAGHLREVRDALGGTTSYAYDEFGNLTAVTDALGRTTRYEYDSLGRLLASVLPNGARDERTYSGSGTLTTYRDFAGELTRFEFDTENRTMRTIYSDSTEVLRTFTPGGQLASLEDSQGTTLFARDSHGRLQQRTDPDGRSLSYAYDALGLVSSMTANTGGSSLTTSYTYDGSGRIATVTDPDGNVFSYDFDTNGRLAQLTYPNGVTISTEYNSRGDLIRLVRRDASDAVLLDHQLTWDSSGRLSRLVENGDIVKDYLHDDLGRLTEEQVSLGDGTLVRRTTYSYDAVGNRLSKTVEVPGSQAATTNYAYDDLDQLTTAGSESFEWDSAGRLVRSFDAEDPTSETVYRWNRLSRLAGVDAADGSSVSYDYDADGVLRRRESTAPGGDTEVREYLVDKLVGLSRVIAELDGSGAVAAHYVRGESLGAASTLAIRRGGVSRFLLPDHVGSTVALADETGVMTDRYDYSAFGELREHQGTDPNPFLFGGGLADPDTGFYYQRARWLDPATGRFLRRDDFAGNRNLPSSLHKYMYANADPVSWVDPTGFQSEGLTGLTAAVAAIGIVGSVAAGIWNYANFAFRFDARVLKQPTHFIIGGQLSVNLGVAAQRAGMPGLAVGLMFLDLVGGGEWLIGAPSKPMQLYMYGGFTFALGMPDLAANKLTGMIPYLGMAFGVNTPGDYSDSFFCVGGGFASSVTGAIGLSKLGVELQVCAGNRNKEWDDDPPWEGEPGALSLTAAPHKSGSIATTSWTSYKHLGTLLSPMETLRRDVQPLIDLIQWGVEVVQSGENAIEDFVYRAERLMNDIDFWRALAGVP